MYAGKTVGGMHVTRLTRSPKTRHDRKDTGQSCSVAMSALPPKADILRGRAIKGELDEYRGLFAKAVMVSERLSLTFSRNTGFLLNLEILDIGARGNRCEIRRERRC